jgi:hypothetical protein
MMVLRRRRLCLCLSYFRVVVISMVLSAVHELLFSTATVYCT